MIGGRHREAARRAKAKAFLYAATSAVGIGALWHWAAALMFMPFLFFAWNLVFGFFWAASTAAQQKKQSEKTEKSGRS